MRGRTDGRKPRPFPKNGKDRAPTQNPGKPPNPQRSLYCAVNVNGVIMPQSVMDVSTVKYADGKRVGHPPASRRSKWKFRLTHAAASRGDAAAGSHWLVTTGVET